MENDMILSAENSAIVKNFCVNDENGNPGMDKLKIYAEGMFGGIGNVTLERCPNAAPAGNPNYASCESCTSCF